jgi:hypothetical protein
MDKNKTNEKKRAVEIETNQRKGEWRARCVVVWWCGVPCAPPPWCVCVCDMVLRRAHMVVPLTKVMLRSDAFRRAVNAGFMEVATNMKLFRGEGLALDGAQAVCAVIARVLNVGVDQVLGAYHNYRRDAHTWVDGLHEWDHNRLMLLLRDAEFESKLCAMCTDVHLTDTVVTQPLPFSRNVLSRLRTNNPTACVVTITFLDRVLASLRVSLRYGIRSLVDLLITLVRVKNVNREFVLVDHDTGLVVQPENYSVTSQVSFVLRFRLIRK